MKHFYLLIFIVFIALVGQAQTDTTIIQPVQYKEAPQDLQKLIEKLKQQQKEQTKKDAEIEIDGLLVNNTKTKNGNDFYELFFRDWIAPVNARNYTISINEKPYRITTTMIEIKINETVVFQSFLQPRIDIIEGIAQQSIARTRTYLENYEQIVKQLEGEDLSGTGIY